ncbi:MAG: M1 family aminopeptidase, partial [Longimicrobiales bacterium]|nr:M1 family aminopeptidase [Longimicrobiales bacterium]
PSSEGWDAERVLTKQRDALEWTAGLFGEYPWPQLTVTDRVEDGATEYPMLYMTDGGAVVHETVHMYAHGILANNEWREGWLDEGMARFLSRWFSVEHGADPEGVWSRSRAYIAALDRTGRSEPVGLAATEFSSYRMYVLMTYDKGALVLRMLRDMLGEEVFRAGLREYHGRYRFRNVTGHDFRRAMERVSGRDLGWFFHQWLETTDWLDWGLAGARVAEAGDGRYVVTAELERRGPAWMPVVVEAGDVRVLVESRERSVSVTLRPTVRPEAVVVDPDGSLLDADLGNQVVPLGKARAR